MPGPDGYLALSAIVKVEATAARVVAWTSQVEKLQKGKYVPEVGRFSTPPHLRDLEGLTIEPGDLVALRSYEAYLRGFPNIADRHVQESFLYWSKETFGMKPIVSITHFSAAWSDTPDRPEAMVVSKQVYATHYRNAATTTFMVIAAGASHYLVYINRSQIDAFKGMFGGFVRRVVERRVLAEAPEVLRASGGGSRRPRPIRSDISIVIRTAERSPIRGRTSEGLD